MNAEPPSRRVRPSDRRTGGVRRARPTLTLDAIVERACAILDAEGIDALTLRRLASELGVGVASMYWHVDDKDELLRLCYQTTTEPLTRELLAHPIDPDKWRAGLRDILTSLFEHFNEHPWLGALMEGPLGQDVVVLRIWDRIGGTLDAAGLEPEAVLHAGSLLLAHLGSMAAVAARAAYGSDGRLSREEGLAQQAAGLAALDPAEYPYVTRSVATFQSHTEQDQFLGGLDIILDGIEVRVARAPGKGRGGGPVRRSRDARR
jgi:AcrR family transcriptional regulator